MLMDNRDRKEIISRRQEAVGKLRAKALSIREIEQALPGLQIVDENGKPWSRATIHKDLKALLEQWRASAQVSISEHVSRQFAELQAAKHDARERDDLKTWAQLFSLEMKLLGTDAPQKFEDWTDKDWREYASAHGLSEADVIAEAERIIAEAQGRRIVPAASRGHGQSEDHRADAA